MKELGLYIHIPFCKKKCEYCDFVSYSNMQEKVEKYLQKLKKEIYEKLLKISENYNISTIYFGGRNSFIYR